MSAVHSDRPQLWTRPRLQIQVHELPAPQGSKRHVGRGVMVESSKKVKPWREAVKAAALVEMARTGRGILDWQPFADPLFVMVTFTMPRPASHFGTGRNAGVVKGSAPRWPARMPDVDKLLRSTLDALTAAGVWSDDAQVVDLHGRKVYPSSTQQALHTPGAVITVRPR